MPPETPQQPPEGTRVLVSAIETLLHEDAREVKSLCRLYRKDYDGAANVWIFDNTWRESDNIGIKLQKLVLLNYIT